MALSRGRAISAAAMSRGRAERNEILSVFMIFGLFWLTFACCVSDFACFGSVFQKNPEVPPPRAAPGVALPRVCPTSAGRTNLAEPPFFGGFILLYMKCAMGRHETGLEIVEIHQGR